MICCWQYKIYVTYTSSKRASVSLKGGVYTRVLPPPFPSLVFFDVVIGMSNYFDLMEKL